jgi:choline dehydrogenase
MKAKSKIYDYLIVGGGSAGCVLANRLSVDSSAQVLMLEAGRKDYWWDLFIHMPAALTIPIGSKFYDWMYESEPEPYMNGRRVYHARGKILGGSSSINGMIFQRGNPMDYERWASFKGLENWSYAHCLPYFKKMEQTFEGDPEFRGKSGPLHLEKGPGTNPLFGAFLKAAKEAGYPASEDVNGYRQEGFGLFDRNVKKGKRWSAARAYYHPVKHRPNLELTSGAFVTKILFEGKKAIGVEYVKRGKTHQVYANDIVLCGGAINSPALLQVSGVGDSEHLKKVGVDLVHHLPGVGENLQDHLEVYIQHSCKKPVSMNPALKWWKKPFIGLQWLFRKGPAATNHFEAGGFVRGNDVVEYPNLMFHFLPLAIRYDGSSPAGGHGYQVHVGPMYSDVVGDLKIKSNDPFEKPVLRFNYLSTENDRKEWIEAVKVSRKILAAPALQEFSGGEISPGPNVQSDSEILEWVAKDAETALHPSCTCKMGVDEMSVLDPNSLKVYGLEGLRVVDASSMPFITNGNIYAPVIMLAEKASDLILSKTPLASQETEFYRHKTDV